MNLISQRVKQNIAQSYVSRSATNAMYVAHKNQACQIGDKAIKSNSQRQRIFSARNYYKHCCKELYIFDMVCVKAEIR